MLSTPLLPDASSGIDAAFPKIDFDLAEYLISRTTNEFIPVELKIVGGLSAEELMQEMNEAGETLDQKRRYGLHRLREVAASTQIHVLDYLRGLVKQGSVRNIQNHWLTNTISVEVTASTIKSAVAHEDIIQAFRYPDPIMLAPDDPVESQLKRPITVGGVEENLRFIGADEAWHMGYTGLGRIVCISDIDGVDGNHPALYANWKGHDGDTSAAWHGYGPGFPITSGYHGTHLMGIMVGHNDVTGDTIGVAPDAKWIGGPGWRVFEWAADPDGDPHTTDDMPDVINLCWGSRGDCDEYMWDIFDMTEALGIVNVFAAGNGGPDYMSLIWPGGRADDSLTNFAIGSVDHRSGMRWFSSSRGPSGCDSISIKPNLCAPGAYIWSSIPGNGYRVHGGTSMAAPHVAGAVAILRQVDPNATAREIKEALIAGAIPYGEPCPNNDCGWGILNIPNSIRYLSRIRLIPESLVLEQNYPNPFNPYTTITFAVPTASQVTLDIYNVLGQRVKRIVNGNLPSGYHQIRWDGKDSFGDNVASGIYFYQIRAADRTKTKNMILLK